VQFKTSTGHLPIASAVGAERIEIFCILLLRSAETCNQRKHFAICSLKPDLQLLNLTRSFSLVCKYNCASLGCWIPQNRELLERSYPSIVVNCSYIAACTNCYCSSQSNSAIASQSSKRKFKKVQGEM
jgi:hypothetical protein